MRKKLLLASIIFSILSINSPSSANQLVKGKDLGTSSLIEDNDSCGKLFGEKRYENFVKVVPGFSGYPDRVLEYVGIQPDTERYPDEYAWANRKGVGQLLPESNSCLGDVELRLRQVGWESKYPIYCGTVAFDKKNFLKRLQPSSESEKNLCELRYVSSGLWIGDIFLDANRDMSWFPADDPSLERAGSNATIITEGAVNCGAGDSPDNPSTRLFYLKGYSREGKLLHVAFNAWKHKCSIQDSFLMRIGNRESFDPRLATYSIQK